METQSKRTKKNNITPKKKKKMNELKSNRYIIPKVQFNKTKQTIQST